MLVQVALIAFALCGMLSLVVDIGMARVTQSQMQNAADSAALEGLRQRNVVADAFQSDCLRRAAANRMVRRTFDDNLDLTDGDPVYQFGGGPLVDITEGATSLHALQTISVPETHAYKPVPQLNQRNEVYGDMVSGRFCYTSDPLPSESGAYELQDIVCTEPQRGSGEYSRNDFNPNLTPPTGPAGLSECPDPDESATFAGPGTGTLANDPAFLVRLRRSNEFRGFTDQSESGIGSSGPSLPLTFGKGTLIHGDDVASDYSVRRDGLTVRATAIADLRPAMRVGLPQANPVQPGVTPFALIDACMQSAAGPAGAAVIVPVLMNPATGVMTRAGPGAPGCAMGAVVGRFVSVANRPLMTTVGRVLPPAAAVACPAALSLIAQYGPVYSLLASGANRIIGFARVNFARAPACPPVPGAPFAATITRTVSVVAALNASADLPGGLPLPMTATPNDVRELVDRHLARAGRPNYAPLMAAVLAR